MTTFRKYFAVATTAIVLSFGPLALSSATAHGSFHGGGHGGFGGGMGGGFVHGYEGHHEHGGHDYGRYGYGHGYCRWNYCGEGFGYDGVSAEAPVCPDGYYLGENSRCWPD